MIRFEYRTYCNEYKIIKVSRKAYIIEYIDYNHPCWMIKFARSQNVLKEHRGVVIEQSFKIGGMFILRELEKYFNQKK